MKDIKELETQEIDAVNGAAHCGVGVTTGNGAIGIGFWYDGDQNGAGVTVGIRIGGGFTGPGLVSGQTPVDPVFLGPYGP